MGFDDHYMKSISILFRDVKLKDCGTVEEEQKEKQEARSTNRDVQNYLQIM